MLKSTCYKTHFSTYLFEVTKWKHFDCNVVHILQVWKKQRTNLSLCVMKSLQCILKLSNNESLNPNIKSWTKKYSFSRVFCALSLSGLLFSFSLNFLWKLYFWSFFLFFFQQMTFFYFPTLQWGIQLALYLNEFHTDRAMSNKLIFMFNVQCFLSNKHYNCLYWVDL